MQIRKTVLMVLFLALATGSSICVYALTNMSNVLNASSNVSMPMSFDIQ